MTGSCEHFECAKVLNVAAWLANSECRDAAGGGVPFTDLARSEPGLRRFSLDCTMREAVVYLKHEADGEWFMLPVSRVTDPYLIIRLEEAARADEPVTEPE